MIRKQNLMPAHSIPYRPSTPGGTGFPSSNSKQLGNTPKIVRLPSQPNAKLVAATDSNYEIDNTSFTKLDRYTPMKYEVVHKPSILAERNTNHGTAQRAHENGSLTITAKQKEERISLKTNNTGSTQGKPYHTGFEFLDRDRIVERVERQKREFLQRQKQRELMREKLITGKTSSSIQPSISQTTVKSQEPPTPPPVKSANSNPINSSLMQTPYKDQNSTPLKQPDQNIRRQEKLLSTTPNKVLSSANKLNEPSNTLPMKSTNSLRPGGLVGLNNLGNTCFMNSTLQCLFNIPDFNQYFLTGQYKQDIQARNTNATCRLADAYAKIVSAVRSSSNRSEAPTALKQALGARHSQFAGYSQQDAQELLVKLLDCLGQDVCRIDKKKAIYRQLTADLNRQTLQQISDDWWNYYKDREDSIVFDFFSGQTLSQVRCSKCDYKSIAFDIFSDLALSFTKSIENSTSVYKLLQNFFKEETLADDYFCARCKKPRQSMRQTTLYRLPKVLVIQLKRFSYGKFRKEKISSSITFPEILDLSRVMPTPQGSATKPKSPLKATYGLIGIVNHSGGIDFGHYTADCKNPFNNRWYNFNDSTVSESAYGNKQVYQSSSPYLLFYYQR